jgi:hypothetical protein
VPDCLLFFDFTAVGNSAQFDNRFIGCDSWTVSYSQTGFATLSLIFQDAPDNAGVPGGWVTFATAPVAGINPNTAITQASTLFKAFYPWQRVRLNATTGGPGRVRGTFFGYRSSPTAYTILSGASTVTANQGTPAVQANRWPVFLSDGAAAQGTQTNPLFGRLSDGTNPLGTATNPLAGSPYLWNGTSWVVQPVCDQSAAFTIPGAGTVTLVALTALQRIRVCHVSFSVSGATNATFIEGTGAACVTGPANLSGAYTNILGLALDLGDRTQFQTTAAYGFCLTISAAVTGGGLVTYGKY